MNYYYDDNTQKKESIDHLRESYKYNCSLPNNQHTVNAITVALHIHVHNLFSYGVSWW